MDKPDDYNTRLEGLSIRESRTEWIIIIGILFNPQLCLVLYLKKLRFFGHKNLPIFVFERTKSDEEIYHRI